MYRLQGEAKVIALTYRTVVALGSNQGDRCAHLVYAVSRLRKLLSDLRVSSFLETEPLEVEPQPRFLNGVAVGQCEVEPAVLMTALLGIERARGRSRPHPGAPRTLDLDLILMGNLIVENDHVQIPHPRFRHRRFVLEPLVAVDSELVDPVSGCSMRELLASLDASS